MASATHISPDGGQLAVVLLMDVALPLRLPWPLCSGEEVTESRYIKMILFVQCSRRRMGQEPAWPRLILPSSQQRRFFHPPQFADSISQRDTCLGSQKEQETDSESDPCPHS